MSDPETPTETPRQRPLSPPAPLTSGEVLAASCVMIGGTLVWWVASKWLEPSSAIWVLYVTAGVFTSLIVSAAFKATLSLLDRPPEDRMRSLVLGVGREIPGLLGAVARVALGLGTTRDGKAEELRTDSKELEALLDQMIEAKVSQLEQLRSTNVPIPVDKLVDREVERLASGHAAAAAAAAAELRLSEYRRSGIEVAFANLEGRLAQQARKQGWTANVNLVVGLFVCLAGFAFLVYVAVFDKPSEITWPHLAAHFLPRITAVALIQVFGWFFVGLYRRGLEQVRYFENEVTNVASRHLAMLAVVRADDKAALSDVVRALINTDRNTAITTATATQEQSPEDLIKAAGSAIATVVKKSS